MSDWLWPTCVAEQAERLFGGSVHNPEGRTFQTVNRRIQHAYRVWSRRHQMNPAQDEYAGEVIAWALRRVPHDKPYPYKVAAVCNQLERLVNDMRVHAGFKRRAELVDVTAVLQTM